MLAGTVQLAFLHDFNDSYVRTRHNNLRCFPSCARVHKESSFCGKSVELKALRVLSADVKSIAVFGEFRRQQGEFSFKEGETVTRARLKEEAHRLEIAEYVNANDLYYRFVFTPNKKWRYDARVSRQQELHVFTVYVAVNEVVVGHLDSKAFMIIPVWKTEDTKRDDIPDEDDASENEDTIAPHEVKKLKGPAPTISKKLDTVGPTGSSAEEGEGAENSENDKSEAEDSEQLRTEQNASELSGEDLKRAEGISEGKPDGVRDGKHIGKHEGVRDGKRDGVRDGKRDGVRDGKRDGEDRKDAKKAKAIDAPTETITPAASPFSVVRPMAPSGMQFPIAYFPAYQAAQTQAIPANPFTTAAVTMFSQQVVPTGTWMGPAYLPSNVGMGLPNAMSFSGFPQAAMVPPSGFAFIYPSFSVPGAAPAAPYGMTWVPPLAPITQQTSSSVGDGANASDESDSGDAETPENQDLKNET